MSNWNIKLDNGRKYLITGGNQEIDITDLEDAPDLSKYSKWALEHDIKNHCNFVDCRHCNRRILCYNNYKGAVLCEKCIKSPQIASDIAVLVHNPWFDFLAGIINPKIQAPVCDPVFS